MKPKISFSIADVPLGTNFNDLFSLARLLKVDGLEVVLGIKTVNAIKTLSKYSQKYGIKIRSIHEPTFLDFLFPGEKTFKIASFFNAKYNIHPPLRGSLDSEKSKRKFERMKEMGKKYDIEIILENMPNPFQIPIIGRRDVNPAVASLPDLRKTAESYNFGMTIDTSHLKVSEPQKVKGFNEAFPFVKNIHLSDFKAEVEHLSLGKGELDYKSFLSYLKDKNYSGIITLELSPVQTIYTSRKRYLNDIKNSIEIIKSFF